jgi:hypothetical protein
MFPYDPTFILLIPAVIFALYAQAKVQGTFNKFSNVASARGFSGAELARKILDHENLSAVKVEQTTGSLTDHYDPRSKTLRLSKPVYQSTSVAALGVVAHEIGHAIQDAKAYTPLKLRNSIVPVASFGSNLAFPLFFVGIFAGLPFLMDLGILLFVLAVVFTVITLPVEFNASQRAIQLLADGGYLTAQEIPLAKQVLSAAALTYVAATTMAVLNLVRLLMLRNSRD